MNSLRPLVTITTIFVVGAFIWVKLNEGPPRQAPAASEAWPYKPAVDVPPLEASASAPVESANAAPPAWPATSAETTVPVAAVDANATAPQPFEPPAATPASGAGAPDVAAAAATAPGVPAMPAMPELPQLSPQTSPSAPPNPAVDIPTQLPANIPTAQYPNQLAGTEQTAPTAVAATAPPTTPAAPALVEPTVTPPTAPAEAPQTPEAANAASASTMNLDTPPLASQQNPLRTATQLETPVDRYAAATPSPGITPDAAAIMPIGQTFATSWPAIQSALERGDLAEAHKQLTRWYRDPTLTPTDAERVEALLSQLAGTVVYSTEHRLEPPYVVKQGESLDSIAQQYNVPTQLLAKINGVSTPDAVQPGQELKVVRGPFSAIVDFDRKELVLMLGERYAGRFAITPPGSVLPAGEWVVQEKTDSLMLRGASPENQGVSVQIGAGSGTSASQASINGIPLQAESGTAANVLKVSPADASELADILSVGSRVIMRR